MVKLICPECGIEFERLRTTQRCCSSKCNYEYTKHVRRNDRRKKIKPIICKNCGIEISKIGNNQKYCSKKCQREKTLSIEREKTKASRKQKTCLVCNKTFLSGRSDQIYCSHNCSERSRFIPELNSKYLENMKKGNEAKRLCKLKNPELYKKFARDYACKYREKLRECNKFYVNKTRLSVLNKLTNNNIECVKCHFSDVRALCIDHIGGGGRDDRKDKRTPMKFYKYILSLTNEEANKKYQILCANCNSIKRIENKEHAKPKM